MVKVGFVQRSVHQLLNGGVCMFLLWLFTWGWGDSAPSWAYFLALMIGNECGNRAVTTIELTGKDIWA